MICVIRTLVAVISTTELQFVSIKQVLKCQPINWAISQLIHLSINQREH